MMRTKHSPFFLKSSKSAINSNVHTHPDKKENWIRNICGKFLSFLLWIFGFFPVSNPFVPTPSLRFRLFHPITLLSLVYIFYPVILVSDVVWNNDPSSTLNTTLLSRHILYFITITDIYMSNSVIRVTALIYCTELIILLQLLRRIRGKISSRERDRARNADIDSNIETSASGNFSSRKKKRNIMKILYIIICTVGSVISICIEVFATVSELLNTKRRNFYQSKRIHLATLPDDVFIRQIFFLTTSFILRLAMPFAISFVAIIGAHLVEIYEQLASILQEETERIFKDPNSDSEHHKIFNTNNANVNGSLNGIANVEKIKMSRMKIQSMKISHALADANDANEEDDYNNIFTFDFVMDFPALFLDLKKAFSIFSLMAGNFTLAILLFAGLNIFQVVSTFTFQEGDYELDSSLIYLALGTSVILFVAHIGEMMTTEISTSKEAVQDYVGKLGWNLIGEVERKKMTQIDRWVRWFLQFEWNLTTRKFFNVRHGLIPAVCGALLTYFIFIFQLRQSENFSSSKFQDSK